VGALDGTLVIDLTRLLPGAQATQILSDHGARVVKIEEPGRGDYLRDMPPMAGAVGGLFQTVNRGKESVAIDLRAEAGRRLLHRMLERADVLVEGFRPGVLERLNLSPRDLLERHPRLSVCRLSGYGQGGPWRDRPGHDLNYLAATGAASLMRDREGRPIAPGVPIGDLVGGLGAVIGILLALNERTRTGRGRVVDAAMSDALLTLMAVPAGGLAAAPEASAADLTGPVGSPSYDVYEAADGTFLTVACLEPYFWANLCRALGVDELLGSQFGSAEQMAETRRRLAEVLATATAAQWEERLDRHDVCVAAVRSPAEALRAPHHVARKAVVTHPDGNGGQVLSPGPPVRLEADPIIAAGPAPLRGEHSRAWMDELGLGGEATELVDAGIVESSVREAAGVTR
jgi:alpha-methylacyl-CoA racemase